MMLHWPLTLWLWYDSRSNFLCVTEIIVPSFATEAGAVVKSLCQHAFDLGEGKYIFIFCDARNAVPYVLEANKVLYFRVNQTTYHITKSCKPLAKNHIIQALRSDRVLFKSPLFTSVDREAWIHEFKDVEDRQVKQLRTIACWNCHKESVSL